MISAQLIESPDSLSFLRPNTTLMMADLSIYNGSLQMLVDLVNEIDAHISISKKRNLETNVVIALNQLTITHTLTLETVSFWFHSDHGSISLLI